MTQQEPTAPAGVEQPILLDLASVRLLLDALGAIALFVTATVALSVHEAVAVTAAVGILVLGARGFRRLGRRSLPSRDVRDQSVTFSDPLPILWTEKLFPDVKALKKPVRTDIPLVKTKGNAT